MPPAHFQQWPSRPLGLGQVVCEKAVREITVFQPEGIAWFGVRGTDAGKLVPVLKPSLAFAVRSTWVLQGPLLLLG